MADNPMFGGMASGFTDIYNTGAIMPRNQNSPFAASIGSNTANGAIGMPDGSPTVIPQRFTRAATAEELAELAPMMGGGNMTSAASSNPTTNYSQLVTDAYRQYLGRAPDAGGLQAWTSALQEGRITPDQLGQNFMGSDEYRNRQANMMNRPNPFQFGGFNQQFVGSSDPYIQAAQQSSLGNLAGAQQAVAANRVNQVTPYSNLQYEQTGTDAQGNPIWTARQTVAPALQPALGALQQRVAGTAGQEFNPQTPSVGINPGEMYSEAIMRRLQPQLERQNSALDAQLANQGIMPGSEAYNRAKTMQAQRQNDLLTAAQVGGINVGLQANQQAYNQALQRYNLPLTQLGAFQQATQPGYINPAQQATVAGPDYLGAYTTGQAANIAAQNAAAARQANLTSGLFGLGSSALLGSGGIPGLFNLGRDAYNFFDNLSVRNANQALPDFVGPLFG
jgi:hypothetical protein